MWVFRQGICITYTFVSQLNVPSVSIRLNTVHLSLTALLSFVLNQTWHLLWLRSINTATPHTHIQSTSNKTRKRDDHKLKDEWMHGQTDGWSIWWRWRGEGWNHDVCNGKRMRCVCSVRCVMLGVRLSEDDGPPCWRLCCPSREPGGNHRTVTQTHALRVLHGTRPACVTRSQEMHLRRVSTDR